MCIIAVCNRKLTKEEFEACWKSNSDGFGMAWREGDWNHFVKGLMTMEDAWTVYERVTVLPHVAHFRIQTAGGVCKELTHPFIVSKASPTYLVGKTKKPVLFHNGVFSGWRDDLIQFMQTTRFIPKGKFSDTRVLAMRVSVGMDDLDKAGKSQKIVVIGKEGITTYGNFETHNGNQFSNNGYKVWRTMYSHGVGEQTYFADDFYSEFYNGNWHDGKKSESPEKFKKEVPYYSRETEKKLRKEREGAFWRRDKKDKKKTSSKNDMFLDEDYERFLL